MMQGTAVGVSKKQDLLGMFCDLRMGTHALLNDSLEEIEEERRFLETAVPILGMMWNLLIET